MSHSRLSNLYQKTLLIRLDRFKKAVESGQGSYTAEFYQAESRIWNVPSAVFYKANLTDQEKQGITTSAIDGYIVENAQSLDKCLGRWVLIPMMLNDLLMFAWIDVNKNFYRYGPRGKLFKTVLIPNGIDESIFPIREEYIPIPLKSDFESIEE